MGVAHGNRGEEYVFSKTINNPRNKSTRESNTWVTGNVCVRFRAVRRTRADPRIAKFANRTEPNESNFDTGALMR